MKQTNRIMMATLGLLTAGVTACGPDAKTSSDGLNIDHQTIRSSLEGNMDGLARSVADSLAFLEESDLMMDGMEMFEGESVCISEGIDPDGNQIEESVDCGESSDDEGPDFDTQDMVGASDDAVEFLQETIFTDDQIESETATSVTYLLKGENFCEEEENFEEPEVSEPIAHQPLEGDEDADDGLAECIQNFDDVEFRLHVTSPSSGDLDVAIWVGPSKFNPATLHIADDRAALDIDLSQVKSTVDHIATTLGEDIDLPQTMQGRARLEAEVLSNDQVQATLSVLEKIEVADGMFEATIAKATPAIQITGDSAAKTLELLVDSGAVNAKFPITQTEWDDETETETETEWDYAIALAGASATTVLNAASDVLTITNIGLGDTTSTFSMDGQTVVSVDINENDNRRFGLTLEKAGDDFEFSVSPSLDLRVAMSFAAVAQKMGGVEDWLANEVFRLGLSNAPSPKVRLGENGVEVVDGELTIAAEVAQITHTASAGMCMLGGDDGDESPVVEPGEPGEPIDQPDPEEEASHPLESMEAGACDAGQSDSSSDGM
jgi:hypothetical protein